MEIEQGEGLTVNLGKTKVMKCEARFGSTENLAKWPCGVCKIGVGSNSIKCYQSSPWIHERCSGVPGKLQKTACFRCKRCGDGHAVLRSSGHERDNY